MGDTEALLLVDDEQAQVAEVHVTRQQAVGADDDVQLPRGQRRESVPLFTLAAKARERSHPHREVAQPLGEGHGMLFDQNRGGG